MGESYQLSAIRCQPDPGFSFAEKGFAIRNGGG
jgi:hypothetical protein